MTTRAAHQRLLTLTATFKDPVESQAILFGEDIPKEVKTFLGRLRVLESIPANYLVPAPEMLPKESIRFFYLDKNWVNSLIDGAYSIGRVSDLDRTQDQSYLKAILQAAWDWVKKSRPEASAASSKDPITGFILRSTLVSHYPSMQMHAYAAGEAKDPKTPLPAIRIGHLAEDSIIGLFCGDIKFLAISKPPEMLHFGFENEKCGDVVNSYDDPSFYIYLRFLKDSVGTETGRCIGWGTDSNRRIYVSQLAETLKTHLSAPSMTSAEFALELIRGADTAVFVNQTTSGDN